MPPATIDIADRTVTRLGFGAMRIMGADDPGALVRRAVDLGAQFIDTADIYGNGASEQFIAEALYPYPEHIMIATKGGFIPGRLRPGIPALEIDCRPERLRRVCDESLRRLRLERIDLYQLHGPDPNVPTAEAVGALMELREEGKLAHIGLSNVGRTHLLEALELTPIASVQNRFNHHDRSSEKVLDLCAERGIAFLPWGPIQTGDDAPLRAVASEAGITPSQAALAWLLYRSPVILPIPGTSSTTHLEENMAADGVTLHPEQLARLDPAVKPSN
jgi:aryl-alcohol dehydrogenase-like predicted oxidoreductase